MTSIVKLLVLATALALTGCAATAPAPDPVIVYKTKIVDTACTWTRIITVVDEDRLTEETARQILAHDKAYLKNCKKR